MIHLIILCVIVFPACASSSQILLIVLPIIITSTAKLRITLIPIIQRLIGIDLWEIVGDLRTSFTEVILVTYISNEEGGE